MIGVMWCGVHVSSVSTSCSRAIAFNRRGGNQIYVYCVSPSLRMQLELKSNKISNTQKKNRTDVAKI
eukprot:m.217900 g.217900  ORF g.217900 m.217900 type:complete len:67 (+) comp33246_c0_seq2:3319-3519(+)